MTLGSSEVKKQIHKPVGIGGNKSPTSTQRAFHPGINPRFGVFIQRNEFRDDQTERNEVEQGREEEHRRRCQPQLNIVIDHVVKTEDGGEGQGQQAELADGITFDIRHNTSPHIVLQRMAEGDCVVYRVEVVKYCG